MVDVTPFLPGLSPVQGKAVVARFDGGRLSSEGGLLPMRLGSAHFGSNAPVLTGCGKSPDFGKTITKRLKIGILST